MPQVNKPARTSFLNRLEYPLYHFNYETVSSALPLFDNYRPFQSIPFQFPLHVQGKLGGKAEAVSFLPEVSDDPRQALIEAMLRRIGPKGSILADNAGLEIKFIEEFARDFSEHAQSLLVLLPRMRELITPFRHGDYAHYNFRDGVSLKAVLRYSCQSLAGCTGRRYGQSAGGTMVWEHDGCEGMA